LDVLPDGVGEGSRLGEVWVEERVWAVATAWPLSAVVVESMGYMGYQGGPCGLAAEGFWEYMDRSMDSAPDPRIGFEPDAWQREVLDGLDEPKTSLLVVGECFDAQHHSPCFVDM
jgi:hypothetical protein